MDATLRPARALVHPAWLVGLGALAVNDWALKGAHVLPGAVTGKLSDVAGLFIAPALFAALVRARTRRAVLAAHVAVAVVFAVVKVVPAATHALEALLSLFVRSRVWTDPTDLVALPMVAVAWWALVPAMGRGAARPAIETLAAAVGAVMCAATSAPAIPTLRVESASAHRLSVTFRNVSSAVDLADGAFANDRPLPITPALFGHVEGTITLIPGERTSPKLALADLAMIEIEDLDAHTRTRWSIALQGYETVLQIHDGPSGPVLSGPHARDMAAAPPCARALPQGRADLAAYVLTNEKGDVTLTGATRDASGCFDLSFAEKGTSGRACVPDGAWPFAPGDRVHMDGAAIVSDDGVTRTSLAVLAAPEPYLEVDGACAVADACGAIGYDVALRLADGARLRSGEQHVAVAGATEVRTYAGAVTDAIAVRRSCSDRLTQLGARGTYVVVSRGPSVGDGGAPDGGALDAASD